LRPGRSTLCRKLDSHDGKITIFERRLRGNPVTPTEKGWIVRCAQVTRQN
jgi:hypothetical protein